MERFTSVPKQTSQSIHWRISNVSQLLKNNSWTSMAIVLPNVRGIARSYSWRLSLFADNETFDLFARAELITPVAQKIPYKMKFTILDGSGDIKVKEGADEVNHPREIKHTSEAQKWRIMDWRFVEYDAHPDDTLDLKVDVFYYGNETSVSGSSGSPQLYPPAHF